MLGIYPDIGHSSVLELKFRQCGAHLWSHAGAPSRARLTWYGPRRGQGTLILAFGRLKIFALASVPLSRAEDGVHYKKWDKSICIR